MDSTCKIIEFNPPVPVDPNSFTTATEEALELVRGVSVLGVAVTNQIPEKIQHRGLSRFDIGMDVVETLRESGFKVPAWEMAMQMSEKIFLNIMAKVIEHNTQYVYFARLDFMRNNIACCGWEKFGITADLSIIRTVILDLTDHFIEASFDFEGF